MQGLPDDRKGAMINNILERRDTKSLELLSSNFVSFDKETREQISRNLLSVGRFEDTYARLEQYKMPNLIQALPDERKSSVINNILEKRDDKSLELLSSNIGFFDQVTRERISVNLLSEDRFEGTYARLEPYNMTGLIRQLPGEQKYHVVENLISRDEKKANKILAAFVRNGRDASVDLLKTISKNLLSPERYKTTSDIILPCETAEMLVFAERDRKIEIIEQLLTNKDKKSLEIFAAYYDCESDARLKNQCAKMVFTRFGEEEITKKFSSAEVAKFIGGLDTEEQIKRLDGLMDSKTAQSDEVLYYFRNQTQSSDLRRRVVLMSERVRAPAPIAVSPPYSGSPSSIRTGLEAAASSTAYSGAVIVVPDGKGKSSGGISAK